MSDLSAKFGGFEGQITTNHGEIIDALNTIIAGLGGAPTVPGTNLADVVTALSTINSNIVGMRTANALYYASALDTLALINTNTDTIINNNSLNAQRIIQAIYATFCDCATDTPLLPPIIDTTPTPLGDDAKCRRVQFYLAVFTTWLTSIANYGSTGASITGGVLETLLAGAAAAFGLTATGAEVGAAAGIPGAIAGAVVGAIVAAVYAFGGSILIDYANQFASTVVQDALRQALYSATTADEGQSAFQGVIADNFSVIPAGIINFLWWSAWSNDLYSDTPVVDDSAFDGTICAPAELCTWITTGNRPDVDIHFERTGPWDDVGNGIKCDIFVTVLSGSVECRLQLNGTTISDWEPAPVHYEFEGVGTYQLFMAGLGHVTELFRVCQTGL